MKSSAPQDSPSNTSVFTNEWYGYGFWRDKVRRTARIAAIVGEGCPFVKTVSIGTTGADEKESQHRFRTTSEDAIVFVEVRNTFYHWGAPVDINVTELENYAVCEMSIADVPYFGGDIFVCFKDMEYWKISGKTPVGTLLLFATNEGARASNRDHELHKYRVE